MKVRIIFGWLTFEVELTIEELVQLLKRLHELFPNVEAKVWTIE